MPIANPFVGGRHIASYSQRSVSGEGESSPAAVPPVPSVTSSAGPSYAMPMIAILIVALLVLVIAVRGAGIRLLGTASVGVGR